MEIHIVLRKDKERRYEIYHAGTRLHVLSVHKIAELNRAKLGSTGWWVKYRRIQSAAARHLNRFMGLEETAADDLASILCGMDQECHEIEEAERALQSKPT